VSVLRTAWNTRWVYLLTLGLTLVWGIAGASIVAWMTQFVLGPYGGEADAGHALARLAELVTANPALAVGVGAGTALTAAVAWIGWTVLGGVVFFAARGDALPDAFGGALKVAGPLTVQGLVHAVIAGVGLVVVSVALGPLTPVLRIFALTVAVAVAVLARDLVRAQICLHGLEKPYHPRATARGFLHAFKHPREVAITGCLWVLKTGLALSLAPLAVQALGPSDAGGILRLVTAVGLALSFLRLAWVTHWTPLDLESAPAPEGDGDGE